MTDTEAITLLNQKIAVLNAKRDALPIAGSARAADRTSLSNSVGGAGSTLAEINRRVHYALKEFR